jgi:RecG-like helicase
MQLKDTITSQFRIDETQRKALGKLGILTIRDLLYYFPTRYTDISEVRHINTLTDGEHVTLLVKI